MKRREFLVNSVIGSVGALVTTRVSASRATRKILIAGGNYGTSFVRYMAELTGKTRPKLCFLPTAAADSPQSVISWYQTCALASTLSGAQV